MNSAETNKFAALTAKALDKLRKELIAIGPRGNPLVSFRKSNRFVVDLTGMDADYVFQRLVGESKSIRIKAIEPVQERELDLPPLTEATTSPSVLLAPSEPDALAAKLSKIGYENNSQRLELGFESLYLALGFLSYFDDPAATEPRVAPLVLIPVSLKRSPKGRVYSIEFNQEDIGRNIALQGRLNEMFGIRLPDVHEESVPSEVFDEVQASITEHRSWQVLRDLTYLGFFSFTSIHMYRDLDEANWDPSNLPSDDATIQWLLADGPDPSFEAPNASEPKVIQGIEIPTSLEPMILDADASQMDAIQAVARGGHLVIQGPPGTGKSQTISNIIAHAVSQGKRVLFVAEKLAALEVVKRRFDNIGLGEIVLELHSFKSNKRAVLEQLNDAWRADGDVPDLPPGHVREYMESAETLSGYATAVNSEVRSSGMSYIEICALLDAVRLRNPLDIDVDGIDLLDVEEFDALLSSVRQFTEHVAVMSQEMGDFAKHPFQPYRETSMDLGEFNGAKLQVSHALQLAEQIGDDLLEMASALGFVAGNDRPEIERQVDWGKRALASPDLTDISPSANCWTAGSDRVREQIETGRAIVDLHARNRHEVIESTWGLDLSNHLETWRRYGRSWFRFFHRDYRETKSELRTLFNDDIPKDYHRCQGLLENVIRHLELTRKFEASERFAAEAFASHWRGLSSAWHELETIADWLANLNADVADGALPRSALGWTKPAHDLPFDGETLNRLTLNLDELALTIKSVNDTFGFTLIRFDHRTPILRGSDCLKQQLETLSPLDYSHLSRFLTYNKLIRTLGQGPIGAAIDFVVEHGRSYDTIETALTARRYSLLVDHVRYQVPEVRDFNQISQDRAKTTFVDRDKSMLDAARRTVIRTVRAGRPVPVAFGQVGILMKQFARSRGHLSIRALINQAGLAIQQITPVFMMSPMSVAKFLKPGSVTFDLVVFDEASQLRTPEAIGSILRANQVVVVGDDKQLPPTRFFMQHLQSDSDDFEDEEEDKGVAGLVSVLDLFNGKVAPSESLLWHYRSQTEELIDFSNRKFYGNELITFPGPIGEDENVGLKFCLNEDDVYIPGTGMGINPREAERIAARVIEIAVDTPRLSLGVVAFSIKQRDAIVDALDRLLRDRNDLDRFFDSDKPEPFFVKNLENVQGDERDVILISVGYGRTSDKKVPMRFGPINQLGGEKRLNVLITRAKQRMEVFASFSAAEMRTTERSRPGLVALKEFLEYAESAKLDSPVETGHEPDSVFEVQVAKTVRELGYEAEAQVGASNYRIDVGVRSKRYPGRYLLGIECDGATYHSARSARERDRLRQEVLEGMGWRIFRIWSTSWFKSSRQQRNDLLKDAIDAAERDEAGPESRGGSGPSRDPSPDDTTGASCADTSQEGAHQGSSHQRSSKSSANGSSNINGSAVRQPKAKPETPGDWGKHSCYPIPVDRHNGEHDPARLFSGSPIAVTPYQFADVSFLRTAWIPDMWASKIYLPRALQEIAKVEGPVHVELAARRIADAVGVKRTRRAIRACSSTARISNGLSFDGSFISDLYHRQTRVRDYSAISSGDRKIGYVPAEEIQSLLVAIARAGIRVEQSEAIRHTLKSLGFQNSKSNNLKVRQVLLAAVRNGTIVRQGNWLASP